MPRTRIAKIAKVVAAIVLIILAAYSAVFVPIICSVAMRSEFPTLRVLLAMAIPAITAICLFLSGVRLLRR